MKKIVFTIFVSLVLFACKKQQNPNPIVTPSSYTLKGNIDTNVTLTSDHIWTLEGRVSVLNGVTLTIEPGTIIKAKAGSGSAAASLIIAQGAKIMADGTDTNPIIFTAELDNIQLGETAGTNLDENVRGLWGGLLILGNAPISAVTSPFQIEGIPASDINGLYGGNNPTDNIRS